MSNKINVTYPSLPPFEEYCEEIRSIWECGWLTNMGEKHNRFQRELEAYLQVPHAVLHTNGHLALENVISAFGFPRGSEIITTPFTFSSTVHAIVRNGLVPMFCDITAEDYTIDASKIEALITEKTRAIVPVHVYGNVCDVEQIEDIARKYGLKVIYDAAHAFGVTKNEVGIGNFGDASIFSFHATKVFHTVEGGAVTLSDGALAQKLNDLKNFGIRGADEVACVGGNAKMSEFQAAMGICNLRHIDEEIEKRRRADDRYRQNLADVKGIALNKAQKGVRPNFSYFPVVFDGYKLSRDEVFAKLKENGINARKYFHPPANEYSCYKDSAFTGSDKTPTAKYIADRVLTLPLYADLALDDIDRICRIILKG